MNEYVKDSKHPAVACVIWMHGLGADAKDMMGLANELLLTVPIRHVFLDAPVRPVTLNNGMSMRAWYDILGMSLTAREDSEGIKQSSKIILQAMEKQIAEGFSSDRLFLAGFSQGGAMALYTGVHFEKPLGGILALSAYLPLASLCHMLLPRKTPIFVAGGQHDPLVLPAWTRQVAVGLREAGFEDIECHEYPMEHQICAQEIKDLSKWLDTHLTSMAHQSGDHS
ncbi:MAG: carboxylesterase [Legionellales bacterium]|nr:carboxylesterase [Legionellales bacterium]